MRKPYLILAISLLAVTVAIAAAVILLERGLAFQYESDSVDNLKPAEYVDAMDSEGNRIVIPSITYEQSENKESFLLTNSSQYIRDCTMTVKTQNDGIKAMRCLVSFQEPGTWLFVETMDIVTQRQVEFLVLVKSGVSLNDTPTVITISNSGVAIVNDSTVTGSWKLWGVGQTKVNYVVDGDDAHSGFIVLVGSEYRLTHYYNIIKIAALNDVSLETADSEGESVDISGQWLKWNDGSPITRYNVSKSDTYECLDTSVKTMIYDKDTTSIADKPTDAIPVYSGQYVFTISIKYKSQIKMEPYDYEGNNMVSNVMFYISDSYFVYFDSNGGSVVNTITASSGEKITEPTAPTKTNYSFAGWYKDPVLSQVWDFNTDVVTHDITLYAKWNAVSVTGVTLNKNSTSIVQGQKETLVATVSPGNASDKTVTWTSDNESVATVDDNGVVTGVAASAEPVTITVTTVDGGYTATCTVTITAPS